MGALIRAHDWSQSPLGPIEGWPAALRMQVSFLLANRFPMLLWWGPTFCSIYNDAYAPILGAKHPWALGRPVSECWSEIWDVLEPLIETPFRGGPPTWIEDFQLEIRRHGFLEEGHFTVAYSPVPDESAPRGIGGVVATVHEISATVFGERRIAALRDLGSRAGEAKTAEQACEIAASTLSSYRKDLPFILLYLIDADGKRAYLAGAAGVEIGEDLSPPTLSLGERRSSAWPLAEARRLETMVVVERLSERFSALPSGPWSDPPHTAVVLAIPSNKAHEPAGLLVAGVSPRLRLDESYRSFFELLRTQIATAIANARAYEEERRKAEALAQIDLAKTAFFSNVSHEFRTPLTLMLGPVEDLLAARFSELPAAAREQIEVVQRNGLRLLRLVNTLLDFSRIEAGRVRASYQPTDLAAFTAELAGVYRAAIERAGMRLSVECAPLSAPVFVDREMWEKVVLNLLSNAFKFTFEGEIQVVLREVDGAAELRVADSGTGIPPEEMPRLFERFHRVENARGRTHEGSGIGLALVQELVRLHGGSIAADSTVGQGTTFTTRIALGSSHLPAGQISDSRGRAAASSAANPFVEEALRWLPSDGEERAALAEPYHAAPSRAPGAEPGAEDGRPRVLVADDNADMRQYAVRLLSERFQILAVADGEAALAAAREHRPDLVLTDVMMPRLDGFGLLRELRAEASTRDIPVILLSARAGEESRVEGMAAGADDYLIKPFSARELMARVDAHVQLARVRREASAALRESEARFRNMADNAPVMVWMTDASGACTFLSQSWYAFTGQSQSSGLGEGWIEALHPDDRLAVLEDYLASGSLGEPLRAEYRLRRHDGEYRWVLDASAPRFAADGTFLGSIGSVMDITDRKQAEERLREHQSALKEAQRLAHIGSWQWDAVTDRSTGSEELGRIFGLDPGEPIPDLADQDGSLYPHEEWVALKAAVEQTLRTGDGFALELRALRKGESFWLLMRSEAVRDRHGNVIGLRGTVQDITERKALELERLSLLEREREARGAAERAAQLKDEFLATLSHELRNPLNSVLGWAQILENDSSKPERVRAAAEVIHRNARLQAQLISDLLDLSRVAAGKMRLEVQRTDLSAVLAAAIESMQPAADAKDIRLESSSAPFGDEVRGDPNRLQQVLWNLLSNAVKFTPRGGRIEVRIARANSHVEIHVSDTGEGIAPEFLPHIFERFRQADASTARRHGGLGIGLALVKQLVELHGGRVWATSPGKDLGSTFVVELPLAPESESPLDPVRSRAQTKPVELRGYAPMQLDGVRALVVDDEPDGAAMVRRILEESQAVVETARSADEALQALESRHFDLLISDIGMPGRDGYDLAREMRARGLELPAIALTAFARREDQSKALQSGFQAHVARPIETVVLLSTIGELLRGQPRVASKA
jgi:PAS domain S-box-containing protein